MEDKELKANTKKLAQLVKESADFNSLEKVELCKSTTIDKADTLGGHGIEIGKYSKYSKDIKLCLIMFTKGNSDLYLWHGIRGVKSVMKAHVSKIVKSGKEMIERNEEDGFLQNSPSLLPQFLDKLLCEKDKDNGKVNINNIRWYVGIYTILDYEDQKHNQAISKIVALYTDILD